MNLSLHIIRESIIETPMSNLEKLNKDELMNLIVLAEEEKDEIYFHYTYPYQGNIRYMIDELNSFIATLNSLLKCK